ncbi:MAG: ferrous iron transport protein [Verrucomicrobiota bacterium]|jgi:ferrous iron transport protein B
MNPAQTVGTEGETQAGPPTPSSSTQRLALAGNPNCGKSTLFNALTGLQQKVGNYPGVTVEKKEGTFYGNQGQPITVLDLPGTYSLQARSPDEAISRDVLLGRAPGTPCPDLVVAVVDATNLERNLYLVSQLLELGIPTVLALNMLDNAEQAGIVVDPEVLSQSLGIPVFPLVATKRVGMIALRQAISRKDLPPPARCAPMPAALEAEARRIAPFLNAPDTARFSEALLLLGLCESQLQSSLHVSPEVRALILEAQQRLISAGIDPISAAVDARYQWITQICQAAVRGSATHTFTLSDRLDRVLTHRLWGSLAFISAMTLMFLSIFSLAKIPMDWIDAGHTALADWVQSHLPEGDFRSLLVDGVIAGVSGVVIFLPQILTLTFFLGLLEDSGYMARAAFMMDRLMSRVGLHGKSFIPMLSSFACAIPGIMATRTIEQRKDRLVTILVSPLMSCSARLPVYALMIAVLLPDASVFQQSAIMLSMYLLGIGAAFLMALLFKKTLLRSETPVLLMEMPPYRMPSLRDLGLRMKERAWIFLKRAGTVILSLSVLLWALTTYPKPQNPDAKGSEVIAHSFAGRIGKALEPAIRPLGFDWKIGIGLVGSLAAREVFVSTMGIVYNVEKEDNQQSESLRDTMLAEKRADGTPVYTPLVCLGLMVFYVLAMQCLSTLAVVRRETNSWRWPAFQFAYLTLLAYLGAFIIYQGGRLLGWS